MLADETACGDVDGVDVEVDHPRCPCLARLVCLGLVMGYLGAMMPTPVGSDGGR
jgi:hypothetical protein